MGKLNIKVAKLSEGLEEKSVDAGTSIKDLASSMGSDMNTIRVNVDRVDDNYQLKEGDVVSVVGDIEGA